MSKILTVTCVHCSQMFTKPKSFNTGTGVSSLQHSPGCGKTTKVHFRNGDVIKTSK